MSEQKIVTVSLNPAIDRAIEVENLVPGSHQVGREVSRTPGGKGVNVSRTLSAMGIASIATGFLGGDNRSEFQGFLDDALVEDRFVTLAGRTRENITLSDIINNVDTHIRDRGLEITSAGAAEFDKILLSLPQDSLVVFSGSLPPGISPDNFASMLDTCIEAGCRVVIDTSGPALAKAISKKLYIAKPNVGELAEALSMDLQTDAQQISACRDLCRNIEYVLLSRGKDGAMVITDSMVLNAPCCEYDKPIRNTVGCGDVMLGSFIAELTCSGNPKKALKRAVANSSACAYNPAAATFDQTLADEFFNRINVFEIF